ARGSRAKARARSPADRPQNSGEPRSTAAGGPAAAVASTAGLGSSSGVCALPETATDRLYSHAPAGRLLRSLPRRGDHAGPAREREPRRPPAASDRGDREAGGEGGDDDHCVLLRVQVL